VFAAFVPSDGAPAGLGGAISFVWSDGAFAALVASDGAPAGRSAAAISLAESDGTFAESDGAPSTKSSSRAGTNKFGLQNRLRILLPELIFLKKTSTRVLDPATCAAGRSLNGCARRGGRMFWWTGFSVVFLEGEGRICCFVLRGGGRGILRGAL
jgi:hypothetical protein